MPTIARIGRLLIQIYADDHNPPHFHVVTPDHEALIRIDDLTVTAGSLPRVDYNAAVEWARANAQVLADEWRRLNER